MSKAKILLVEDDESLGYVIQDNLEVKGFSVTLCKNGMDAIGAFKSEEFDLCLLDVMLPRVDGFEVARYIREANQNIPILFLTAKSMQEDKLQGFKIGADDYITKPFSMEELLYRMEVFLKRTRELKQVGHDIFTLGEYQFDDSNLKLIHPDQEYTLTQKEAKVLSCFCHSMDQIVRREEILKEVWGENDYFLGRSLDVFISKLRKYLKRDPAIKITNYHGVGFKLTLA